MVMPMWRKNTILWGVMTGFEDPTQQNPPPLPDPEVPSYMGSVPGVQSCTLDGISVPCALAHQSVQAGSAVVAPAQTITRVIYQGQPVWAFFQAYADGYQGFVPATARYTGNGQFSPFSKPDRPALYVRPAGAPRDTNFAALNGATEEALLGRGIGIGIGIGVGWGGSEGNSPKSDNTCICPETTVHIWNTRGSSQWGHASVTLSDGTHISWWPAGEGRERWVWPLDDIYEAPAVKNQTFADDVRLEVMMPDKQIKIRGLNEDSIKKWWNAFKDSGEKWKSLSQNCSTVSFLALSRGFSGKISTDVFPNTFWAPSDVDKLAEWLKTNSKCECK